jgi:hypothetical protein
MSFLDFLTVILVLGFTGVFGGLGFIAYASKQSYDNPLRVIMGSVASRIAVTLGIGLLDIPITAIEPIGGVIDVASLAWLGYYWFTGVRQMIAAFDPPKSPPGWPTLKGE